MRRPIVGPEGTGRIVRRAGNGVLRRPREPRQLAHRDRKCAISATKWPALARDTAGVSRRCGRAAGEPGVSGDGSSEPAACPSRTVRYHSGVAEFYDFDRANARIPELRETLLTLRSLRVEVVGARDRIVELNAPALAGGAATAPRPPDADQETQRLRLRMQGLVDQMQAAALQIDGWGIQLRDIETGLVDFPALVTGRPVWLCWRLDETDVGWWHEVSEGFGARRRIEDLV